MDEKEDFRDEFLEHAIERGVSRQFANNYYDLVFEIAIGLMSRGESPLTLGISGAQGTGKSTFAKMLAIVLERVFEKSTLVMSLDDFYLTKEEREALAELHPLLRVRGVPGTHDVALMRSVLTDLKAGKRAKVPVFSKAKDDRETVLPVMGENLDLLIVEGWCWGALPSAAGELVRPINRLEVEQDPDGSWRRYVNRQLAEGGYQELFKLADVLFFMAAPTMDCVVKWRWQQEQDLAKRRSGPGVMNEAQVREFVMYYERVTVQMLKDMPAEANLTLFLDEQHKLVRPPRNMRPGA